MKMTLYHGTDCLFEKIELGKSDNYRDFGKGFYTTTISAQAESWARSKKLRNGSKHGYVYVYELEIPDGFRVKKFDGLTVEWLEMIKENRSCGGIRHDFDILIGPVANDDTRVTVSRYMSGIYTAEEAIRRLEFARVNDQVTFHTDRAVKALQFMRRYTVE